VVQKSYKKFICTRHMPVCCTGTTNFHLVMMISYRTWTRGSGLHIEPGRTRWDIRRDIRFVHVWWTGCTIRVDGIWYHLTFLGVEKRRDNNREMLAPGHSDECLRSDAAPAPCVVCISVSHALLRFSCPHRPDASPYLHHPLTHRIAHFHSTSRVQAGTACAPLRITHAETAYAFSVSRSHPSLRMCAV
jgi:hypothetical protein